jgi:ribonuclease HII
MLNGFSELQGFREGYSEIIGIDEAGRGCLAGPVAVGYYIYTPATEIIPGVTDSKLISPKNREKLYDHLSGSLGGVEMASASQIDSVGIAGAIERLIFNIVKTLRSKHSNPLFIIDGRFKVDFGADTRQLIKADRDVYSVSAASILAKVLRDRLMCEMDIEYPVYGFAKHKGYGNRQHLEALDKYGPSLEHRRSFRPISEMSANA